MSVARCCCPKPGQPPPEPDIFVFPTDSGYWQVNGSSAFGGNPFANQFGFKVELAGSERVSGFAYYDIVGVPQGATILIAELRVLNALFHGASPPPGTAMWTDAGGGFGNVPIGTHFARCDIVAEDADFGGGQTTPAQFNAAPRTAASTAYSQFFNNVDGVQGNVVH